MLWSWSWNYLRKDRPVRIIARSDADKLTDAIEGAAIVGPSAAGSAA